VTGRYSPLVLASQRATMHVIAFAVDEREDRARELARTYPAMAPAYAGRGKRGWSESSRSVR